MADLKKTVNCAVCGMNVKTDEIKSEYEGHTHYFCSESDKKLFMGNPEKYLGKAKAA